MNLWFMLRKNADACTGRHNDPLTLLFGIAEPRVFFLRPATVVDRPVSTHFGRSDLSVVDFSAECHRQLRTQLSDPPSEKQRLDISFNQ